MSPAFNGSFAPQHFECSNAVEICNKIMFDFYPGLSHMSDVESSEKIERNKCCISIGYRRVHVYRVYTPSVGSISNLYHIEMVNYNSVCVNYSVHHANHNSSEYVTHYTPPFIQ